jgi:hypothetical protein
MNIVFLVTHVIMVICFLSIMRTSFELSTRWTKREKDRSIIPVLKEDPAPMAHDFKKKISKDTSARFKQNINQKILSKSAGFRYDMERLN